MITRVRSVMSGASSRPPKLKSILLAQEQRHRFRPDIAGERFVNWKTRTRIDDFVAGIAVGLLGQADGRFAARENDDAIR